MEFIHYIRSLFGLDTTRKRRANADPEIDNLRCAKIARFSSQMSKDNDWITPSILKKSTMSKLPRRMSKPMIRETIVLDEEPDFRLLNFSKLRNSSTSTPIVQSRKFQDKDVEFVKEIKTSAEKKRDVKAFGYQYLKPLSMFKALDPKEPVGLKSKGVLNGLNFNNGNNSSRKSFQTPLSNYTIQLDEKKEFQSLLDSLSRNSSLNSTSIYQTPSSRLSLYDSCASGRSRKMVNSVLDSLPKRRSSELVDLTNENEVKIIPSLQRKRSVKDTLRKVLEVKDKDVIDLQDSESDVEILPNPPSPKPDFQVEPINSLKTMVDTSDSTRSNWLTKMVESHKRVIEDRYKEIQKLSENNTQLNGINKELQIGNLISKVDKCLAIKDAVLPVEEEEEELPALTEDQVKMINRAFTGGNSNEVMVKKFNLSITRKDILTLAGLNWLNDEVINFYMDLIAERSRTNQSLPKVHSFNTFFYPKLIKDGYSSLRRWTRRVDLFDMDVVCVPIHLGVHWCMAVIDFRIKKINYYDSMGGNNNKCLAALRTYLESEHSDKKKAKYDTDDWKTENVKDIPQQMNGSDCGMFSCTFAEYYTRNARFTFKQDDMPYLRSKMVVEILTGQLLIE